MRMRAAVLMLIGLAACEGVVGEVPRDDAGLVDAGEVDAGEVDAGESMLAKSMPVKSMPVKSMPAKSMQAKSMPVKSMPVLSMLASSIRVCRMRDAPTPESQTVAGAARSTQRTGDRRKIRSAPPTRRAASSPTSRGPGTATA